MEKRSNALSIVLGLICAGLVAYIAFDKPMKGAATDPKDSVANRQRSMLKSDADAQKMSSAYIEGAEVQKTYCALPPATLIDLIRNYKSQVWTKTSNAPGQQYDARFMEVSIEQLENFLAYAKASAAGDGTQVTSVRLYYINYPGAKKTESDLLANHNGNAFHDYAGCHSIAFVPVVGDSLHDPNRKDYFMKGQNMAQFPNYNILKGFDTQNAPSGGGEGMTMIPGYDCNASSTMMNHNEVCPPMAGCATNTLLSIADQD